MRRLSDTGSADHQPDAAGETRHQPAHVGEAKRDAAGGRLQVGARAMEEDRAAAAVPPRMEVVVEDEHDVVKAVVPPHLLVAAARREAKQPVVERLSRLVAPAVHRPDRPHGDRAPRARQPVRPEKAADDLQLSGRRGTVALAFRAGDATPADGARDGERADRQSPAARQARRPRRRDEPAHGRRFGRRPARGATCGVDLQSCAILPVRRSRLP